MQEEIILAEGPVYIKFPVLSRTEKIVLVSLEMIYTKMCSYGFLIWTDLLKNWIWDSAGL